MELDFVTSDLLEGDGAMDVGEVSDVSNIEGERCGICMDIIIDRGVLDCCQHWFCFECIDNWATITNLCPLCQNEFQLITCVSVCDTTGNNKIEEESLSRENEWCVDGKGDSPSTPSYYIDENAVICLDGDGCKYRNGSTSMEEDCDFDTSIACDSCDIWYHASCVGFDPEATSDDTWLCPRCQSGGVPQNSSWVPAEMTNNWYATENAIKGQKVEAGFCGNVSVSVADDGETALVVSMIGSNAWIAQASETSLPSALVDCSKQRALSEPDDDKNIQEGEKMKLPLPYEPSDVKSLLLDDLRGSNADEDTTDAQQQKLQDVVSEDPKANKTVSDASLGADNITGMKRKNSDCSIGDVEARLDNVTLVKKSKAEGKSIQLSPIMKDSRGEEDATPDIFSFVRGTDHKPSKTLIQQNPANKSADGDNVAGLRVKKIMRGTTDAKESSAVVERLRREIREVVRNKSTKDIGENLFDPKLLAAFRAAIVGPKTEHSRKLSPLALKAKKSMLQKGKVRENLTKKIYGDSNGKRRHAWVRECEVEFWKHRCLGARNPEKIDTLKSVLSLLRKDPDDLGRKQSPERHAANPVLSRLYLADTSVFPRKKDDVRPLSVLTACGNSEQTAQENMSLVKSDAKVTETNSVSKMTGNAKPANFKSLSADDKVHAIKQQEGRASMSGDSRAKPREGMGGKSDDWKKDKRKWAMEVLARKKALTNNHSCHDKQEDLAVLKGKYPLLAQLPADMRPALATSRHNKIPVSIRQAQLYRLTEHLLKKADLPVIQRSAATELAIADAINIEKEIVDKSNSKVVYLNLCSQEILHHSDNKTPNRFTESNSPHPEVPSDRLEHSSDNNYAEDPLVKEALRTAGLLSDSPPNSPIHKTEALAESGNCLTNTREEGTENVLEIDSRQDVDIYGDFEYDLEDQDYIVTSTVKAPKLPVDECVAKVKVVFSSVKSEESPEDLNTSVIGRPDSSPSLSKIHRDDTNAEMRSSPIDDGDGKVPVLLDSSTKENEGFSLAECEELYGADREPEMRKSRIGASTSLVGWQDESAPAANPSPGRSDNVNVLGQSVKATDPGTESNVHGEIIASNFENSSNDILERTEKKAKEKKASTHDEKQPASANSVLKKVEAYIKEHIRPLCKSGVITAEQYRWAVTKSAEKVMKYHSSAKNASFLIKEGEKVKRLAEQYVEAAQQKGER